MIKPLNLCARNPSKRILPNTSTNKLQPHRSNPSLTHCISRGSLPKNPKNTISMQDEIRSKKIKTKLLESMDNSTTTANSSTASIVLPPPESKIYEDDIIGYLFQKQTLTYNFTDYLRYHYEIDSNMRAVLVNWMVDIQNRFRLARQTLFMSVNLLDRFLSMELIPRNKLQLVGVTCLFIAAKYEQIYSPPLKRFVQICDGAYKTQQLLDMESKILIKLDFNFSFTSSYAMLNQKISELNLSPEIVALCGILLELSLIQYNMCKFKPSIQSLTSIYIASKVMNTGAIKSNFLIAKYSLDEPHFKSCVLHMFDLYKDRMSQKFSALKNKYSV